MGIREEQYLKRKEQILQIALDEFIAKGYYGTSTREIAKIAGISSGLMFHYFESKQALYEALVEIGTSQMDLIYQQTDSPIEVLRKQLNNLFDLLSQNPYVAKIFIFMGSASYNAFGISQKAGDMIAAHDLITQSIPIIQKGQELGEIRSGDSRLLSICLWCSVQGIAESIAMHSAKQFPDPEWILSMIKR